MKLVIKKKHLHTHAMRRDTTKVNYQLTILSNHPKHNLNL